MKTIALIAALMVAGLAYAGDIDTPENARKKHDIQKWEQFFKQYPNTDSKTGLRYDVNGLDPDGYYRGMQYPDCYELTGNFLERCIEDAKARETERERKEEERRQKEEMKRQLADLQNQVKQLEQQIQETRKLRTGGGTTTIVHEYQQPPRQQTYTPPDDGRERGGSGPDGHEGAKENHDRNRDFGK